MRACRWWDLLLLLLSFSFVTNRIPFSFYLGKKTSRCRQKSNSRSFVRSFVRHVLRPSRKSLCRGVVVRLDDDDLVFSIREWIRLGRRV